MIGYVARDKCNDIYIHTEKPVYDDELQGWYSSPDIIDITGHFPEFDGISYKDEPIKVEITIKRV